MHLKSLIIKMGTAGISPVKSEEIALHDQVAKYLMGHSGIIKNDTQYTIPINYNEAVHEVSVLGSKVLSQLRKFNRSIPLYDRVAVVDFTSNPFFILREPLLLALANGMLESIKDSTCQNFILVTPKMPGDEGAFVEKLGHMTQLAGAMKYSIYLVSANGGVKHFSHNQEPVLSKEDALIELFQEVQGDPLQKLEAKCVRRLGHFRKTSVQGNVKCRQFSYIMHDCNEELLHLLEQWWSELPDSIGAIVYDLGNNHEFKEAVLTHASKKEILAERIDDVLKNEDLAHSMVGDKRVVLIVDVVDSGETLQYYLSKLKVAGLKIHDKALTAINKGGHKTTLLAGQISVDGLVARDSDVVMDWCPQCGLDLVPTSEIAEDFLMLRTYDFFFMLEKVGWEAEPVTEIPQNGGEGYERVPNFTKMLEEFGDWIAFKLYNAISTRNVPDNWFVLQPEEAASSALSVRLNECMPEELTVVRVPRSVIDEAQLTGNVWSDLLVKHQSSEWANQLRSMSNAGALVLDIFNGSDSTCRSLKALLIQVELWFFSYACLVDFNPSIERQHGSEPVSNRISLHDWHCPREFRGCS